MIRGGAAARILFESRLFESRNNLGLVGKRRFESFFFDPQIADAPDWLEVDAIGFELLYDGLGTRNEGDPDNDENRENRVTEFNGQRSFPS